MKRIIIDYQKLTDEILDLLVAKYPDGYNNIDIISLYDKNKNRIDAIEVRGEDFVYLVKVSKKLANSMEEHNDEDENDSSSYVDDFVDESIFDETTNIILDEIDDEISL